MRQTHTSQEVVFKFGTYTQRQDQIEALRRVEYVGGKTNIASALILSREQIFTAESGDR